MTNLTESATWHEGVYQIETTDPVVGGPPNIATKAGLTNIPALQLAERTGWLKAAMAGIGGAVDTITDLNSHTASGFRFYSTSATGNPQAGQAGYLIHVEGDGMAFQQAHSAAGNSFTRFRSGSPAVWTEWVSNWQDSDGAALLSESGYQKLPSGLIIQWCTFTTSASGSSTVNLPMTFPNAMLQVYVSDNNSNLTAGQAHYIGTSGMTTSSVDVIGLLLSTLAPAATTGRLFAIGH